MIPGYEPLNAAEARLIAAGWRPQEGRTMTLWRHPALYGIAVFGTEGAMWEMTRASFSALPANAPSTGTIAEYAKCTQQSNGFTVEQG